LPEVPTILSSPEVPAIVTARPSQVVAARAPGIGNATVATTAASKIALPIALFVTLLPSRLGSCWNFGIIAWQ
jgi:hypothetical protein